MLGWFKKEWIAEINIKSNWGSMFITANLYQVARLHRKDLGLAR
jgi:hypothetical protein